MRGGSANEAEGRRIGAIAIALAIAGAVAWATAARSAGPAPNLNGFSLQDADVAADEILRGGPPRDGIPALDAPYALPAATAAWPDDTRVVGVSLEGRSRAYPVPLLNWHELVNDELAGHPILVSYCPLCGTGMVFDRRVSGPGGSVAEVRSFGVSGLLYRSDVLMYDRETESLWSQILARAVTGSSRGRTLTLLRSRMDRWDDWRSAHPETTILSPRTGHERDYGRSPYAGYARSERLVFPAPRDRRYHPKTVTLGLRVAGGSARAYPSVEVARAGGSVAEQFDGEPVRIAWDPERGSFRVSAPDRVEVVEGYWFAWAAFHPESSVFVSPTAEPARETP